MTIGKAIDLLAFVMMVSALAIIIAQSTFYGAMFIPVNIAPLCILLLAGTIAILNDDCNWPDEDPYAPTRRVKRKVTVRGGPFPKCNCSGCDMLRAMDKEIERRREVAMGIDDA